MTLAFTGVALPPFDVPGGYQTEKLHLRLADDIEQEIIPTIRAVLAKGRGTQAGKSEAALFAALAAFVAAAASGRSSRHRERS